MLAAVHRPLDAELRDPSFDPVARADALMLPVELPATSPAVAGASVAHGHRLEWRDAGGERVSPAAATVVRVRPSQHLAARHSSPLARLVGARTDPADCVAQLRLAADTLYRDGIRSPGVVDDSAVGGPAHLLGVDRSLWQSATGWDTIQERLGPGGLGVGGTAFILLNRPGREGHAFLAHHDAEHGTQWIDLNRDPDDRMIRHADRPPLESAVDLRVLFVDAQGRVRPQDLTESGRLARALVDAPSVDRDGRRYGAVGMEIEHHSPLLVPKGMEPHHGQVLVSAHGLKVVLDKGKQLVGDKVVSHWIAEIVVDPGGVLPEEHRHEFARQDRMVQDVLRRLRSVSRGTTKTFAELFPAKEGYEVTDAGRQIKVDGDAGIMSPYTQFSIGVPTVGLRKLLQMLHDEAPAERSPKASASRKQILADALVFGQAAVDNMGVPAASAEELSGFLALVYEHVAAKLYTSADLLRGNSFLTKNYLAAASRTSLQGIRNTLSPALREHLDQDAESIEHNLQRFFLERNPRLRDAFRTLGRIGPDGEPNILADSTRDLLRSALRESAPYVGQTEAMGIKTSFREADTDQGRLSGRPLIVLELRYFHERLGLRDTLRIRNRLADWVRELDRGLGPREQTLPARAPLPRRETLARLRELTPPTRVRTTAAAHPDLGHAGTLVSYQHRVLQPPTGPAVDDYTVRVNLQFASMLAGLSTTAVQARALAGVDHMFNRGYLTGRRQLNVNVEFVDADENPDHVVDLVTPDTGRPTNQLQWSVSDPASVLAHEIGHMLGLTDEYPNDGHVPPADSGGMFDDATLMGYALHGEDPGLQQRHLDQIRQVRQQFVAEREELPAPPRPTIRTDYVVRRFGPDGEPPFAAYLPPVAEPSTAFPGIRPRQPLDTPERPPLKVSEDGTLAVHADVAYNAGPTRATRAREFYATEEVIDDTLTQLRQSGAWIDLVVDWRTRIEMTTRGVPQELYRVTTRQKRLDPDISTNPGAMVSGLRPAAIRLHADGEDATVGATLADGHLTAVQFLAQKLTDATGQGDEVLPELSWATGTLRAAHVTGVRPVNPVENFGAVNHEVIPDARAFRRVARAARHLGLNERAWPEVGEAYAFNPMVAFGPDQFPVYRDMSRQGRGDSTKRLHLAHVVARSEDGRTQITLEQDGTHQARDEAVTQSIVRLFETHPNGFADMVADLAARITDQRLLGDDDAVRALTMEFELAVALHDLWDLRNETDLAELAKRRTPAEHRAGNAMLALVRDRELPGDDHLWHFQMYGRGPGETFHEQHARPYDPLAPVSRVHAVTAVLKPGVVRVTSAGDSSSPAWADRLGTTLDDAPWLDPVLAGMVRPDESLPGVFLISATAPTEDVLREARTLLNSGLRELAAGSPLPIFILPSRGSARHADPDDVAALTGFLGLFAAAEQLPLVVARREPGDDLRRAVDRFGAPLLHPVAGAMDYGWQVRSAADQPATTHPRLSAGLLPDVLAAVRPTHAVALVPEELGAILAEPDPVRRAELLLDPALADTLESIPLSIDQQQRFLEILHASAPLVATPAELSHLENLAITTLSCPQ